MSWKAEKCVDPEGLIICTGHGAEAVFRTSRTAANPDRDFYACDVKPSCNFFIWADDENLIRVMNKRAEAAASAEVQTIGRPPSSSVPNAAHLSTPNKNAKASSSSLPTPPKSTTNKSNPRRREPSPDWPDELVEDEEEGDGATARKLRESKRTVLVEEDEIVNDAEWDTDGEQVLQAGPEGGGGGGSFKFRDAAGKGKKRARELDSDDDGSGDYKATEMEKRRKAIEENMKRMRAEQNTPEPSAKSSSSKPTSTGTLQTPPVSPTKIQSTSSLADKKTIDFLRSANSKLRDEKTSLEKEVKQLEGEYAELVDEVCGLKAKESDWEEEREKWGRRVEVLEGGKRVGK